MIAEPFLLNEDCSPFVDNDTSSYSAAAAGGVRSAAAAGARQHAAANLATIDRNATAINLLPAKSLAEAQHMTNVRFAFWIMAALMVIIIRPQDAGYCYRCCT